MKNNKDWRAEIKDIDNLYDIDPLQIMIFIRHQYLQTAKDMLNDDWDGLGIETCQVAESLQLGLEAQVDDLELFRF